MIESIPLIIVLLASAVVIALCIGRRATRYGPASTQRMRPLLKQFGELTVHDFARSPVWVQCHVIDYDEPWYKETDEETFRPWEEHLPVDPGETMFLVLGSFTLADGTVFSGFVAPRTNGEEDGLAGLARIQPSILHPSGRVVGFWFGGLTPEKDELTRIYALLGKTSEQVFPIRFEAKPGLAKGLASGTIPGFCYTEKGNKIAVIR